MGHCRLNMRGPCSRAWPPSSTNLAKRTHSDISSRRYVFIKHFLIRYTSRKCAKCSPSRAHVDITTLSHHHQYYFSKERKILKSYKNAFDNIKFKKLYWGNHFGANPDCLIYSKSQYYKIPLWSTILSDRRTKLTVDIDFGFIKIRVIFRTQCPCPCVGRVPEASAGILGDCLGLPGRLPAAATWAAGAKAQSGSRLAYKQTIASIGSWKRNFSLVLWKADQPTDWQTGDHEGS